MFRCNFALSVGKTLGKTENQPTVATSGALARQHPISSRRSDYLDAARGVAILMVILVHTAQTVDGLAPHTIFLTEYGQMGVQLFFIVSAVTLCQSYERRSEEPNKVVAFYVRRYFRIAPLYYAAIAIYLLLYVIDHWPLDAHASFLSPYKPYAVVANILFVHGFVPSANNNVVPGGWSIGTEMAFYAIFPGVFWIARRLAQHSRFTILWLPAFALMTSWLVQFVIAKKTALAVGNNTFLYFNIVNQIPVFMLGMAFYFVAIRNEITFDSRRILPLAIAGILTTSFAMLLWKLGGNIAFTAIPFVSALSFVFFVQLLGYVDWAGRWLPKIGYLSYSMYVIHFLFAWSVAKPASHWLQQFIVPELVLAFVFTFVILATYAAAQMLGRYVEAPGIAFGKRVVSRMQ